MRGMGGSKDEGFVPELSTGPPTAPRPASTLAPSANEPLGRANRHLDSRRWFKPSYDKGMVKEALDGTMASTSC